MVEVTDPRILKAPPISAPVVELTATGWPTIAPVTVAVPESQVAVKAVPVMLAVAPESSCAPFTVLLVSVWVPVRFTSVSVSAGTVTVTKDAALAGQSFTPPVAVDELSVTHPVREPAVPMLSTGDDQVRLVLPPLKDEVEDQKATAVLTAAALVGKVLLFTRLALMSAEPLAVSVLVD